MNFDINSTLTQMLQAIKDVVKNDWNKISESATDFFEDRKERLHTLATQRLNGEIDDNFLQRRLDDEKDILRAELDAEKILAKAMAQNAANAAIDVLSKAIAAAVHIA